MAFFALIPDAISRADDFLPCCLRYCLYQTQYKYDMLGTDSRPILATVRSYERDVLLCRTAADETNGVGMLNEQ